MQDRIRPLDEVLLQRTAGPYIWVKSGEDISAGSQPTSALPQKQTNRRTSRYVRFVALADLCTARAVIDHPIGSLLEQQRHVRPSTLAVLRSDISPAPAPKGPLASWL